MKKILILLSIVTPLITLNAQKSRLQLQFTKIDREVNAMGLSTVTVQVTNSGDSIEHFGETDYILFYAKKTGDTQWKRFSQNNYVTADGDMWSQKILPGETIVMEDMNLNIMHLVCDYSEYMGDLVSKSQPIWIKAGTFDFRTREDVYSDSVSVQISPLSQTDKIAFDSIQIVKWRAPFRYTAKDDLFIKPQSKDCSTILQEFPTSTFADLAHIGNAIYCISIFYNIKKNYTSEMHAQAKQYLSEVRHTEFEYIRHLVREAEAQLAEIEKKGF